MMKKLCTFIFSMALFLTFATAPCKAAENTKEKYVDFKGVKIYTEAYNYSPKEKEAIIFLHGLGGSHLHGQFLYDQSNPYMTITLDYLDHGLSGHVPSISWDTQIDSIKAVLDAYGITKAHLIAHSMGADTAMMFAKKYPKMVKDIVLLDRAYYNFVDLEKYNMKKSVYDVLEYDSESGLSYNEFLAFMNMTWYNDISKTWGIKKSVLLLGGSTEKFKGDPSNGTPSLADIIAMVKQTPEEFGVDPELAKSLPDVTEKNLSDFIDFLKSKVATFPDVNKRFSEIQTPYAHGDMVRDAEAMNSMRSYVLDFLKNENKNSNNTINNEINTEKQNQD